MSQKSRQSTAKFYAPTSSKTNTLAASSSSGSGQSSSSKAIAGKAARSVAGQRHDSVLFLEQSHVSFEPPTQKVSVFFDECNREIISTISGFESKTRVVFQATGRRDRVEFVLPVEKRILSIKFNPDHSVLAYHVEKSNIEFINTRQQEVAGDDQNRFTLDDRRYVQASRTRNSKLLGFLWTGPRELVMMTDISVEYYHLDPARRRLKHIRSFQSSTNWFVYQPAVSTGNLSKEVPGDTGDTHDHDDAEGGSYSVLMVSTGSLGNSMQPYLFHGNQIIRLQRFEVDGNWHGSDKLELFERSVTIASIYGLVRLLVLQHESLNVKSKGAQILIYTIDHVSGITSKTHTLDLDVNGRFAINILDNLVIAHDQPSKSSFIFDIMVESTEKSDWQNHYVTLIDSQPIRPLKLSNLKANESVEMYSLNWVFFQPNFIIDAKKGLLSTLHLDLKAIQQAIHDNLILLSFLAHRKHSEQIVLDKCRAIVAKSYKAATGELTGNPGSPLAEVSSAFEILSRLVISAPEMERKSEKQQEIRAAPKPAACKIGIERYSASVTQTDVYREVFKQLELESDQSSAHQHFEMSALLEFIFFVRKLDKNVEFCIYEQLLKCLVRGKRYYQIVQMIRSAIFQDSKQIACLLLSLRAQFRPAVQLGIDMLHRLDCLNDLIESLELSPNPAMLHSETVVSLTQALNQSLEIETGR